jgi:hypothetical protein
MDTNLFKVSKICWVVTSRLSKEPEVFNTIESAADHLEGLGVPDEEIDYALIDMASRGTAHAVFSVTNGAFTQSDNTGFEKLGIA